MLLKKKNLSTVIETAKTGKGSQDEGKESRRKMKTTVRLNKKNNTPASD